MTCAVEKQAKVWDAERLGAPRLNLSGHTGIVLQVLTFCSGSRVCASGAAPLCYTVCKSEQSQPGGLARATCGIRVEAS